MPFFESGSALKLNLLLTGRAQLHRAHRATGIAMHVLAGLMALLAYVRADITFEDDFYLTSLYYEPNEMCRNVSIQIEFTPRVLVNMSDYVKVIVHCSFDAVNMSECTSYMQISMPRFTSGPCTNTEGSNIP